MAHVADAKPGDPLPSVTRNPDAREVFVFRAASWQPPPSGSDDQATASAVPGELRAAWMSQCVTDWLGDCGSLSEFSHEHKTEETAAGTYEVHGSVTGVDTSTGDVTLELRVESGAGVTVSTASARVRPV